MSRDILMMCMIQQGDTFFLYRHVDIQGLLVLSGKDSRGKRIAGGICGLNIILRSIESRRLQADGLE
jgi:hypothetical protein